MSDFEINKGVGREVEFKGLRAQYLFIFAFGLLAVFVVFVIMYTAGIGQWTCIAGSTARSSGTVRSGRPVRVRNPVFPAALRDSARPPAHRPLGVHAVSSAGRPNSRELTAACNGDCPTHSRLSGNITSATASTETTAKIHFRFIATSFL